MLPGVVAKPSPPTPATAAPGKLTNISIPPAEDPLLQYLTNTIQKHGHRARAARITSRTLMHLHTLTRSPALPILRAAVFAASPAVRSLMHRHGAKNVAKPVALGEKQRTRVALGWMLEASRGRAGRSVEERLAREVVAVVRGESEVLKRKEEVHRFAMVNRWVVFFSSVVLLFDCWCAVGEMRSGVFERR